MTESRTGKQLGRRRELKLGCHWSGLLWQRLRVVHHAPFPPSGIQEHCGKILTLENEWEGHVPHPNQQLQNECDLSTLVPDLVLPYPGFLSTQLYVLKMAYGQTVVLPEGFSWHREHAWPVHRESWRAPKRMSPMLAPQLNPQRWEVVNDWFPLPLSGATLRHICTISWRSLWGLSSSCPQ